MKAPKSSLPRRLVWLGLIAGPAILLLIPYVNLSVRADPFDGNVWQDFSRTYGNRLLGMFGLGR